MTVKQGEDINKQFTLLNDSLSIANKELLRYRSMINSLSLEVSAANNSLFKANRELDLYKSSYMNAEADLIMLERKNNRVLIGLFIIFAAWTGYTISVF